MKLAAVILALLFASPANAADYVDVPGGSFASALPADDKAADVMVAKFQLRENLVTNAEFLAFVTAHPEWRRDRVASVFAEARYLTHWATADSLGTDAMAAQPVTQVSWFAAQAFCEAEGGRLPAWSEWELSASAF